MKRVDVSIAVAVEKDELWRLLPTYIAYPDFGEIRRLAADPEMARLHRFQLAPESRKAVERLAEVAGSQRFKRSVKRMSDHDILRDRLLSELDIRYTKCNRV